jgi:hypothetical protein
LILVFRFRRGPSAAPNGGIAFGLQDHGLWPAVGELGSLAVSDHITQQTKKGNMKKTWMIGIVAVALAAAFAVLAAEKKSAGQKLVRLKVDGKTVAELRVLDSGAFSVSGDQVNHVVATATTTAKGATLQFGGASGKSVIVKAEEVEVLPSNE